VIRARWCRGPVNLRHGPRRDVVIGDATVPFLVDEVHLEAGKVRSEATVHTHAKTDVPVLGSVEVDVVRVGEFVGVAVGHCEVAGDASARWQGHSGKSCFPVLTRGRNGAGGSSRNSSSVAAGPRRGCSPVRDA